MLIERAWAMPNKNTFDIQPIQNLIWETIGRDKSLWIDPFANCNHIADITNDLNPSFRIIIWMYWTS